MRLNLSNVYSVADFDFTWNLNLIDSQCEDITAEGAAKRLRDLPLQRI